MRRLRTLAPAKVNLRLRVLAREDSGYHQIETLFQALDFGDEVEVAEGDRGIRLEVEGMDVGPVEENLAYRAAVSFLDRLRGDGGVSIRLRKRVPPGAGLGGGSSDGAAVLRLLAALHPGAVGEEALLEIAAGLGADVPFFLAPSPLALAWGRGDRILPLSPLPPRPVLLALPPLAVDTPGAYGMLDEVRGSGWAAGPALLRRVPASWQEVGEVAGIKTPSRNLYCSPHTHGTCLPPEFVNIDKLRDSARGSDDG